MYVVSRMIGSGEAFAPSVNWIRTFPLMVIVGMAEVIIVHDVNSEKLGGGGGYKNT